jgi:hypothetical protein
MFLKRIPLLLIVFAVGCAGNTFGTGTNRESDLSVAGRQIDQGAASTLRSALAQTQAERPNAKVYAVDSIDISDAHQHLSLPSDTLIERDGNGYSVRTSLGTTYHLTQNAKIENRPLASIYIVSANSATPAFLKNIEPLHLYANGEVR